jgi:N-acetylmuramoyl-L-alanine amidase
MKRFASATLQSARERALAAAGIALALSLCLALPARGDKLSDARDQFAHAVTMRTMLEGFLDKDRSLADYKKTIAAYHKVYLITPKSEDVTPALIAEAELYEEMGRLYDARYFDSAIVVYRFLLKQYPGSRYRGEALLAIASVQKDELHKPDDAEATYKEYLKLFPHSEKAREVLADLRSVSSADTPNNVAGAPALPDLQGPRIEPQASENHAADVTHIRTWNAEDSTRIMVTLDNTVRYTSARIASPDRIYFDLYKARLNPSFPDKSLDVPGGLLKSVRVAQNRVGVVRIVLDVSGARNYSAYLLGHPYRLVIDVRGPSPGLAQVASGSASIRDAAAPAPVDTLPRHSARGDVAVANPEPPAVPKPTRDGERSLARVLDLKIRRIVIDPGHGGRDTGTIGPHGLMEKDVCLDVALRLGRLIEKRLPGAQVIYTRKTDVYIPLEERTAIANRAKADLFISIHANSSSDPQARGVETYYLNFATSREAMAVAARENATSDESVHDLQDLIKQIARNDKIQESREFAEDVQDALSQRLRLVSRNEKDRGVKKAPFVVLIGANMPSVLAEISFLSNPTDERLLRKPEQRERIADGLYRGIATYLKSLNSLTYDKQKTASDRPIMAAPLEAAATVAPTGNPK